MANGIGSQRMSGVQVPQAASQQGSGAKDAAVASGIASLIQTGANIYSGIQEQERAQQAQQQAVDIENTILNTEKSMLEQSMNFEQAALNAPQARSEGFFDTDGSGDLSEDEAAAQSEYNKKRDRILNSALDPRRRQMMLIETQQKLMAKYPGALESIRKKLDATRDRVSVEDQLFSSEAQFQEYQERHPGPVNARDYANFKAEQAYVAQQSSYGEMTMDNLRRQGNAIADTGVLASTQRLFAKMNASPEQYTNPQVFQDTANAERERLISRILTLKDSALNPEEGTDPRFRADPEEVQEWADDRITSINTMFDNFIEAKDPRKAVKNANQMNEQLVENKLFNLAPATMSFIGKDSSGQTVSQLFSLMNSSAGNAEQKLQSFLGPDFQKEEAGRIIKFFSALQNEETRREFLVQSPYAAGNLFAANGANGGTESDARGWIDSFEAAMEKHGAYSPETVAMLGNLANRQASEGIVGKLDSDGKLRLKSRVEGMLKNLANRTSLGSGDAGGPQLARRDDGSPVVVVEAFTGGGQQRQLRRFEDKQATKAVQSLYQLYQNQPSLGNFDDVLEQVFPETTEVPQPTQQQEESPATATPDSTMLEEIEDFVASKESLATLDSARNRRIRKAQREAITSRYEIDDTQFDSLVSRLESGESFEEIVNSL